MHKVAFHFGSWAIYWYGVLVASGFLAGLWTASRRGLRDGLPAEKVLDTGVWIILGAMLGSRALFVATYWNEEFAGKPFLAVFNLRQGGLVFYGGLIGASLATVVFARLKQLPLWKLADAFAPSIALGAAFGRLGCLMNGCCFGRDTGLPWAIHFPADHATQGAGVHPTQVYDSLLNLALYAGLAWLYRRKKFDGQVFAAHLIGYALLRSLVEVFRGDYKPQEYYLGGWVSPAQFVSVGILVVGLVLLVLLPRPQSKK
ncbi:MAG: prolipoprotein diacylglyceryl transferase [Verrucomicrobia bacterium]|nr:prolipoprotein diacylglyceryl transferase [Verrucomicrobiota bacterium]